MPFIIQEACFSRQLELTANNFTFTENLLNKGVKSYPLPGLAVLPSYRFVKSIKEDIYCLLFESPQGWKTLYAVKLIYRTEITYPQKAATQIMVWRASSLLHKSVLDGLAQLFFSHLLSQSNIVISDNEQTVHGQRFWKRMLEWAFYNHFYVYACDGTESEDWTNYLINDFDELSCRWEAYIWGNDRDVHTHRLFIISKNELGSANNIKGK